METNLKSFIFLQIKPFKWHMLGFFLICILWSLDLSFRPFLIKMMLDRMSVAAPNQVVHALLFLVIGYIALAFVMSLFFRVWNFIRRSMAPQMKANITQTLTNRLLEQSYQFYQNNFAGTLANKINDVSQGIPQMIDIVFESFIGNFLAIFVASMVLAYVRPMLCLIFLIWAVFFLWGSWAFAKKAHVLSDTFSEKRSRMTGHIVDILGNMNVVRLFTGKNFERHNIKTWTEDLAHTDREFDLVLLKMFAFQSLSFVVMQSIAMIYLIYARSHSLITIGDFALTLTINIYIVDNLWNVGQQFNTFAEQLGKVSQGLRMTMEVPDLLDHPQAKALKPGRGTITFEQIEFQYRKAVPLFSNLSIEIPAGRKVGLVGYSGSGKTSFVNLILRLFDIQKGRILIDGQDIASLTQDSLRSAISFIPQDPTLFHRSILDNIRYANPEASFEEVVAAAKGAHAHEFIINLADGYDAMVGERGIKLSGGQRQRIAIARAILKNAPILILDEATSALDSVTEQCIQESLHQLMQGHTTLVIAHRLSTLLDMDEIIVFDQGKIVEAGPHKTLLKKPGLYKTLWAAQVGGFLPD